MLANLSCEVSHQTIGNVLRRDGTPPTPECKRTTACDRIHSKPSRSSRVNRYLHGRGCDASRLGHVLCAVLLQLESRRVDIAGITIHPNGSWVPQIARNVTMDGWGNRSYLLHDRDKKYSADFRTIIESGDVETTLGMLSQGRVPVEFPLANALCGGR